MKLSVANEPVDLSGGIARLSREDYNALTIVTKIRRAIRYEIDNSLIATFIKKQFDLYLDAHFIEEEVWLFPKLPHTDAANTSAEATRSFEILSLGVCERNACTCLAPRRIC